MSLLLQLRIYHALWNLKLNPLDLGASTGKWTCGEQLCTTTLVPGGRFIPLPSGNEPMGEVWGPHVDPTSCFESEKGRHSRKPCRPQHDGRQWICKQLHNSSWCLSPHDFEARNQSVDVGIAWSGGSLQKSAYTNLGSFHERKSSYMLVLQMETQVLD